ncbi:hypothetical protein M430DRAFT_64752 [Amorphotheca resinae ATCC 22711]|uniref:Uncharacterized protein n=1 Tax=Amorphotheca resinae ATCC 22711 TaxID=857342 RepID=A0A2T3B870_AMORE|nr:hypothetical protein M430DRAFT_64752 [Amorphotheca resinae ATCC 22711]PSS23086.1 hypothetical protein M430DRAFT_64752 [Amorphotheca resinae ATCC 22711]
MYSTVPRHMLAQMHTLLSRVAARPVLKISHVVPALRFHSTLLAPQHTDLKTPDLPCVLLQVSNIWPSQPALNLDRVFLHTLSSTSPVSQRNSSTGNPA